MLDFSSIKSKANCEEWVFIVRDDSGSPFLLTVIKNPRYIRRMTNGSGIGSSVIGEYIVECPFHKEKTPSCLVFKKYDGPNVGKDTFHCLGCGRCGDCIFEKVEHVDISDRDFEFEQETLSEIMLFGSKHLLEILVEIKSVFKQIEDGVEELDQRLLLAYFNAIIRYAIILDEKLKSKQ